MVPNKFYHCTDDEAVTHLEKELNSQIDLTNPRHHAEDILEAIISPQNNGDLHFKSLLTDPEKYNIEARIVEHTLQAFYTLYWDREFEFNSKLELEIFPGSHNETAFVEIKN